MNLNCWGGLNLKVPWKSILALIWSSIKISKEFPRLYNKNLQQGGIGWYLFHIFYVNHYLNLPWSDEVCSYEQLCLKEVINEIVQSLGGLPKRCWGIKILLWFLRLYMLEYVKTKPRKNRHGVQSSSRIPCVDLRDFYFFQLWKHFSHLFSNPKFWVEGRRSKPESKSQIFLNGWITILWQ